ncbi:uncharacterized protein PV09_06067 [Verruconis gallopava]|uniref:AB hydrolase-1 domain-containing protein n=1 Tax=Verruconis gallopava TaxID=253628 RepID=A0A0D1YPS9_9PEZI|nr:uncharacterized protein PV09_06067 [Verruconis gallopava]KIW02622.1 hypothetical protein PV09_06067 [Verruconis gallopava]
MIHGLLQSAGAYASTDDHSFAFFFAKQGYDVWLGNNRCGLKPRHRSFKRSDPRMWSWKIREMATMDLPALVEGVLQRTGFEKLALVGHSQGTSQILIALSKHFVPELGEKISVACLLAPAAYSGSLLENPRWFFKGMIMMSPTIWRLCFGRYGFMQPLISAMEILPNRTLGVFGYPMFHYLFDWSDRNWDRDLRDRSFLFAPTYISSEHMRWWIGADGFATQRCILNTRAEAEIDAADDEAIENFLQATNTGGKITDEALARYEEAISRLEADPWFDERVPPLALWIPACDDLVDGKRLLRRLEYGRDPHAQLVHVNVLEDYEHLDVIWGVDSLERVGKEVLKVIWQTIATQDRERCVVPACVTKSESHN